MKKSTFITNPIPANPLDDNSSSYTPVINEDMISSREAIARINRKLIRHGRRITPNMFYHRVLKGDVRTVKIGNRYFFHPYDIDKIQFSPETLVPIEPKKVHSLAELQELAEIYGPLVDMEGMLDALETHTGHRYSAGAIKQRLLRKTIWFVAYTGDERKNRWYPLMQIEWMNLQPKRAEKKQKEETQAIQQSMQA